MDGSARNLNAMGLGSVTGTQTIISSGVALICIMWADKYWRMDIQMCALIVNFTQEMRRF